VFGRRLRSFVVDQKCIPWRVRSAFRRWRDGRLRAQSYVLYRLLRYGTVDVNTQEYWDRLWTREPREWRKYEQMFGRIAGLVPRGSKVLDVGCGRGKLLGRLRAERECDVTGTDISAVAVSELAEQGIAGRVAALPEVPFADETFDVAVATEVLEHLSDPSETLRQMCRVLRPSGLLVVSVPNDCLHPGEEVEHMHSFTKASVVRMLEPYVQLTHLSTGTYRESGRSEYLLAAGVKRDLPCDVEGQRKA